MYLSGGQYTHITDTSVMTLFVTGSIALLYSLFLHANPAEIINAIMRGT